MEKIKPYNYKSSDGELFQTRKECQEHEIYLECNGTVHGDTKEEVLRNIDVITAVVQKIKARKK